MWQGRGTSRMREEWNLTSGERRREASGRRWGRGRSGDCSGEGERESEVLPHLMGLQVREREHTVNMCSTTSTFTSMVLHTYVV